MITHVEACWLAITFVSLFYALWDDVGIQLDNEERQRQADKIAAEVG